MSIIIEPFRRGQISVRKLNQIVAVLNAMLQARIVRGKEDKVDWVNGQLVITLKG